MFRAKSVVVLLLLVARVACVEEIPAYRLLQYDAVSEVIQSDGEDLDEPERVSLTRIPFGATQSGFSLLAAPVFPHEDGFRDRSHMLVKNVALVRLQDVNMSRLESWVDGRRAGAVLILLPSIPANIQATSTLESLSSGLLSKAWPTPIYFTPETSRLNAIYEELYGGTNTLTSYAITALVETSTLITSHHARVLQATLSATSANRTLLIFTNADTFSVAPGLPNVGASTSAAPVTAALLAMKALGKLYANPSTVGKYNIVLVVATASAGMWDNAGMKAWLRKSSTSALLANVELAMHLQSVGNDPIVYSTSSLQLPAVLAFTNYSGVHVEPCLDNSDSVLDVKFPIISVSNGRGSGSGLSSVTDQRNGINDTLVAQQISNIALAIAAFALQTDVFHREVLSQLLEPVHVVEASAWLDALLALPRFSVLMDTSAVGSQSYWDPLRSMQSFLSSSSVGCQVAIQSCDATLPHLQFYSGLTATLVVADIISPFVDIGLTFGIVGYGIALYAVMKGREGLRILARALRLGGKANDKDE